MRVTQLTPHIGAEVTDFALKNANHDQWDQIKQLLLTHKVLILRDQLLTKEEHVAIASEFGVVERAHPFFPFCPDHDAITFIETKAGFPPLESHWHTDHTWRNVPSTHGLLHAQYIPEVGGDTLFVSMTAVFESLSESLQQTLRGLSAVHSMRAFEKVSEDKLNQSWHKNVMKTIQAQELVVHPLVKTHPQTGDETLFFSQQFVRDIQGLNERESSELQNQLSEVCLKPEFQCRVKWQPNTLVIWDNQVTQHYAVIDYGDTPRKLHRVTVSPN